MNDKGQIYELINEDVQKIVDEILKDNSELKEWVQADGQIRERIESIFYADDPEMSDNIYRNHGRNYYGTGKRAGLYLKDSRAHICVRAMALDFIKIIFSPTMWKVVKNIYCKWKKIECGGIDAGDIIVLIDKIKNSITQNVVKLRGEGFCFYLQMITHFAEHQDVGIDEILDWLPKAEDECSWSKVDFVCLCRQNEKCLLKSKAEYETFVREKLDELVKEKVLLKNLHHQDQYRINY